MDFAIRVVIFFLTCPTGKCFLGKFKLQKDCNQSCKSKRVLGLVEMTCGLVHASYSLPEWQAVKLIFFHKFQYNPSLPSIATDDRKRFQCLHIVLRNKTGLLCFVIQLMQRHISAFQKDSKYCYIAPLMEFKTTTKT